MTVPEFSWVVLTLGVGGYLGVYTRGQGSWGPPNSSHHSPELGVFHKSPALMFPMTQTPLREAPLYTVHGAFSLKNIGLRFKKYFPN